MKIRNLVLPFASQRHLQRTLNFDLNFNFEIRRDHQKNFYERRDYESVDEKSLS